MKWIAGLLALWWPLQVQACEEVQELVLSFLAEQRLSVQDIGHLGRDGKRCVWSNLEIRQSSYVRLAIAEVSWTLEGFDSLMSGQPAKVSLDLAIDDARIVPSPPDAPLAYLMDLQNKWNTIDVRLVLNFEPETGALDVAPLKINFPGDNHFNATLAVSIDPSTLTGAAGPDVANIEVNALDVSVQNTGFLEGLAFGFLAGLLDGSENPAADVARWQARAKNVIAAMPASAIDADSKLALRALIDATPLPRGTLDLQLKGPWPLSRGLLVYGGALQPQSILDAATLDVGYAPWTPPE